MRCIRSITFATALAMTRVVSAQTPAAETAPTTTPAETPPPLPPATEPAGNTDQAAAPANNPPASGNTDDETAPLAMEDVMVPGRGRVQVNVTATRAGPFNLGLSPAVLTRADAQTRFTRERVPVYCKLPCTVYLRPGVRRLVGDAGTDFPWSTEITVPENGTVNTQLRGHLIGLSATGGLMFILGIAGTVGGPGVVIIYGVAQSTNFPPGVIIGGAVALGTGVGLLVGGLAILAAGAPRLEGSTTTPAPPVAVHPVVGPDFTGAALTAHF